MMLLYQQKLAAIHQENKMVAKIAEVRINKKAGIVQIKMNNGLNHVLDGKQAVSFQKMRNAYMCDGDSHSEAALLVAKDYIAGRLP